MRVVGPGDASGGTDAERRRVAQPEASSVLSLSSVRVLDLAIGKRVGIDREAVVVHRDLDLRVVRSMTGDCRPMPNLSL